MDDIERRVLLDAISTSHHLGVANRLAQNLIKSESLGVLVTEVENASSELGLSGYVAVHRDSFWRCGEFGSPSRPYDEMLHLFSDNNLKVQVRNNKICIRYPLVTLLVEVENADNVPVFQDTLATFCEAINSTVRKVGVIEDIRASNMRRCQEIGSEVLRLSDQLKNLSSSLQLKQAKAAEDLLSGLAALFPVIGLEGDQEEQILSLVEKFTRSLEDYVSNQVDCTQNIRNSLLKIMNYLGSQIRDSATIGRSN